MTKEASTRNLNTQLVAFQSLWNSNLLNGAIDNSQDIHQQLVSAYQQPQRFYHNLDHIEHCLSLYQTVQQLLNNPAALALAIWFHDAIYEPGEKDNEQRSADWFLAVSKDQLDNDLRDQVYELIMATLHCCSSADGHDAKYMVDIDLSSFGMPWQQFIDDSRNVRKEFPDISDADFYPKQCGFSQGLLDNPKFYQSDYFFKHYEVQARQNISDYFQLIQQKLSTQSRG